MADEPDDLLRKIDALPISLMKRRLARQELIAAWDVADAVLAAIAGARSLLARASVRAAAARAAPKKAAVRSSP